MHKNYKGVGKFLTFFYSPFLVKKQETKRISYTAVVTAFLIVANTLLEIKFSDVQFSITLLASMFAGVILGAGAGFTACVLGDAIGFIINSWGYVYMPWVGLTSGVTAMLSGLIFYNFYFKFRGGLYLKLLLICLSSFLVGTVLINSTGFYLYNYFGGFSKAVIDYVSQKFGSDFVGYFGYLFYRLIFKGQIFNCLFNYALFFITLPLIIKLPYFKD